MFLTNLIFQRGKLPIVSLLMFIGGFSVGSWLTLIHQLQAEKDLIGHDLTVSAHHTHQPILTLVVLIFSAPTNFESRDTLRSTWLQLTSKKGKNSNSKHLFVIGTENLEPDITRQINQEQLFHADLLLLPKVVDSYNNLTLKLTESLTYISSSVPFRYVLKCDDDSIVRMDAILEELEERQARIREKRTGSIGSGAGDGCFIWGFFDGRAMPQRTGKWKEGNYNLCDLYLPYALGGGYVISDKCSDFIVRNQAVLKTFSNEDTTVGTWLSVINTEKRHDVRFDTEWESRGCSNKYLVQHKITQTEMAERYQSFLNTGKLCPREFRRRPSYEYDWTVPPSQCCRRNATII